MNKIFFIASLVILASCGGNINQPAKIPADTSPPVVVAEKKSQTNFEKQCIAAGLIDIHQLDTNIIVDLKYSTTNNFMGFDMYGDFDIAYLQKDVAEKLVKAQKFLTELNPGYRLIVYDAVRPASVQQLMWDSLNIPLGEKIKFLSDPKKGSLHNYGAAVDLSITDNNGKALDMGTPFDHIGILAAPESETQLLNEGKLTRQQVDNRKLLRKVMKKAGFFGIQSEWWHFNSCTRKEALARYKKID